MTWIIHHGDCLDILRERLMAEFVGTTLHSFRSGQRTIFEVLDEKR